jgi:hypothetical protein
MIKTKLPEITWRKLTDKEFIEEIMNPNPVLDCVTFVEQRRYIDPSVEGTEENRHV